MEGTGKIVYVNEKKTSFKLDTIEGFLTVDKYSKTAAETASTLTKLNKGDTVTVTYVEKGQFKNVSVLEKVEVKEVVKSDTQKINPPVMESVKKTYTPNFNEDRSAQIQKGNALNAAAAVLAGTDIVRTASLEEVTEMVKVVANNLFEYLKG
jgi:hypothetical protein